MNKPVYLGLSILLIRKTRMYQFWNGYVKLYGCRYSFIFCIKEENIHKNIAGMSKKDLAHQTMKLEGCYHQRYSYLTDDDRGNKSQGTKEVQIKIKAKVWRL